MKKTLTVLCAGLALSWVAAAGAQQPQQHQSAAMQAYPGGQSGQTGTSGQSGTEGQSGSQKGTENESSASRQSREVKLIGCLAQGSSPDTFVLNNVQNEMSGKHGKNKSGAYGSGEQTGTSGTTGMSGEQGEQTNMNFELVPASSRVDLKKYVGQKVEIRGRVEPAQGGQSGMSSQGTSGQSGEMGGMSGSQGTSGQSGSMSGQSGSMSGQSAGAVTHEVRVQSVKKLSSSCQ